MDEMANQRMYLRCKACGAEKMIAKRMIGAYYTAGGKDWADGWDKWFEEHKWGFCAGDSEYNDLDIFELSYEHVDEDGNPRGA